MSTEYAPLFRLSVSERLQLVEDLWESIAAEAESVPMPDWQKEELARRKAEYLRNPEAGSSWNEVKQRVVRGDG